MCRIAGILNSGQPMYNIEDIVINMCNLQKHGGPDDSGIYNATEDRLVLGNRRLSLLDLSNAGHMPMQYQDHYYITYNGEIYNYLELKRELTTLGHHFTNHSDTEVILAAYSQWGSLSFSKLKGMFAFALWDNVEKELLLVRDAVGIKPIYYSTFSENLFFASEIRAFNAIPQFNEQNKKWPVYMMAYGHIPEPVSTLKEVKPLHKGCFLKYDLHNKNYTIQSFAHFSYSNEIQNWLKEQNIELYSVGNAYDGGYSAPIVERFNRSYRNFMQMLKTKRSKQNYNQLSVAASREFPQIYNNTVHNTTGITPNEAFDGNVKASEVVKETFKTRSHEILTSRKTQPKPFLVGDMVFLQKPKKTIENKFDPKFDKTPYKIIEVLDTEPTTYRLENHPHAFYRKQLRKSLIVNSKYAEKIS